MYLATLIASFCAIQSVFADASFLKDARNCKRSGNDATPVISCECKKSNGNWVSCTADIGSNFVNKDHKLESRPGGSAPATCTEFNLKDNVLGANCGGLRIALINLEDVCSVNDGKLVCSKKGDTRGSTPTSSASTVVSTTPSTGNSALNTVASSGSGQNTASPIAAITTASSSPESQTSVSASETISGASASTDATNSCGCGCGMTRRSRIMGR